jgi:glycosyltransferase involved in cell wall biosynthesis
MRDKFGVSLVVPVYNSAAFLPSTIAALTDYLAREFTNYELIMVDDGSVDQSLSLIRSAADKNKNIRLLVHEKNLGQQQALAHGFLAASNAIVLSVDADLPCELTDLKKIAKIVHGGTELVFAKRIVQIRRAWWRTLGSNVANVIFRLIYPFEIQDIGCGLVAMRPSLIEKLRSQKRSTGLIKLDLLLAAESYIQMDIRSRAPTASSYSFFKLLKLFLIMVTNRLRQ